MHAGLYGSVHTRCVAAHRVGATTTSLARRLSACGSGGGELGTWNLALTDAPLVWVSLICKSVLTNVMVAAEVVTTVNTLATALNPTESASATVSGSATPSVETLAVTVTPITFP